MKKLFVILLAAALLSTLSACGTTAPQPAEPAVIAPAQTEETEKEASYPFEDADGRVHHLIYINDALVKTEHDA